MYKARVLIISERKEHSIKYKKLIEGENQDVIIADNLSSAMSILQNKEIEFIIISDTIKDKLSEFVKKIRILTFNSRPIIIAVSKSNDLEDKLEILDSGADDFIGEEISKQEFQMRFRAHLRRYMESYLNPITHLSDKNITIKAFKKSFESNLDISYLLMKIKNFEQYKKTHGEIAAEKVLQTLGAILNSTCAKDDYIGHINDNEFFLITSTFQAEKIASFLTFAFDNILNKFYSEDEFNNNFSIQFAEDVKESKIGLMRLSIVAVEKNKSQNDYRMILNSLNDLIELCNCKNASTYIIDRFKLKGEVEKRENKVLIYEPDNDLSYLLKNVCEINNIKAKTVFLEEEFFEEYVDFRPNVVVIDWGQNEVSKNLEIVKKIAQDNIKLIFTSSFLNKKEILKAGADLYIPKPYEIDEIFNWIKKFLN